MKKLFFPIVLLTVSAIPAFAQGNYARQYVLDERICNKIPVTYEKGSTNLKFPSPFDAIRAGRVFVNNTKQNSSQAIPPGTDFYAIYQPDSSYISIRALKSDANDIITFVIGGKLYNVELFADKQPVITATFFRPQQTNNNEDSFSIAPERGTELIRQAQAFDALNKSHPEAVEQVDCFKPQQPLVIPYNGWMVLVNRVWRFEQDDTLVFWISFLNSTDSEIHLDKNSFTIVTGDGTNRYYQASVIDSVSVLPPAFTSIGADGKTKRNPSMAQAWFTVTGDGHGGRNWLRAEDNWNVLVSKKDLE
jgi:hypothetical protein